MHSKRHRALVYAPEDRASLRADEVRLIPVGPRGPVRVGVVYPSPYTIGMSNLGHQLLLRLAEAHPGVHCERYYLEPRGPHRSLDSDLPLSAAGLLLFSLTFELDAVHIVRMLAESGIEPRRRERDPRQPLIVVGGMAATSNPRPIADIADVICLGEGEPFLGPLLDLVSGEPRSREVLLERAAELPAAYVPAVHGNRPESVAQGYVENVDAWPVASAFVTPHTEFSDCFLVEAYRGCPYKCNFCLSGYAYRRVRERSPASILGLVDEHRPHIRRVGLIGAGISVHRRLVEVVEGLLARGLSATTSSLRLEGVDDALLAVLVRAGQETLTIAPETGGEALRRVVNKRVTDEEIVAFAQRAGRAGMRSLKTYFLVGVPGSTKAEAEDIVRLVKRIIAAFRGGASAGKGDLVVSLSPFVPKQGTPWGAEEQLSLRAVREQIRTVKKGLSGMAGVRVNHPSPSDARIQALLSQGDESLSEGLIKAARLGDSWREALRGPAGTEPAEVPRCGS